MTDIDRDEIRRACERLVTLSAVHNDERDWTALSALYADDAVLQRPSGPPLRGRDEIEASYRSGASDRVTRHVCANIDVRPTSATTATGSTVVLRFIGEQIADGELPLATGPMVGFFTDEFVREGDTWRISSRVAGATMRARPIS
jgi:ketosteroid isomerase-like protein